VRVFNCCRSNKPQNILGSWLDLWGSCDSIGHVTIWSPSSHFLWVLHCNQVCIASGCRDNGPIYIGVMTLTYLGHVTSSVTWPFDSPYAISYWWSIGTKRLSPAVFEILSSSRIEATAWHFRVTWRHQSRDHSIRNSPFPIGGPLAPSLYL